MAMPSVGTATFPIRSLNMHDRFLFRSPISAVQTQDWKEGTRSCQSSGMKGLILLVSGFRLVFLIALAQFVKEAVFDYRGLLRAHRDHPAADIG